MTDKTRILFLSANPWTTSRILVDEEAREIFERLQEGPYRDQFELQKHAATRPVDLQRLLLHYEPHIVHFSGHGSKKEKLILGGTPGRGKTVDQVGLAEVFALYQKHLRLVFLNACFTRDQARSIAESIDYSVGTGRGIGDKGGVAFAGAFYRALGFGKSIKNSFDSAKAELGLTRVPRTRGIELFIREGVSDTDPFPRKLLKPGNKELRPAVKVALRGGDDLEQIIVRRTEEVTESRVVVEDASTMTHTIRRVRSEVTFYRNRQRDGGKD
jgi:hypothetical protein